MRPKGWFDSALLTRLFLRIQAAYCATSQGALCDCDEYLERGIDLEAIRPRETVVLVESDGGDSSLVQLLKVDVADVYRTLDSKRNGSM